MNESVDAGNVSWQGFSVDGAARSASLGQSPCVIWFTGLPGAGKSTISNLVEVELHKIGLHTYLIDGDNVRHGLNRDLGFSDGQRSESVRRVSEVAKLMVDSGLIVVVSLISPFRADRLAARRLIEPSLFLEVFIDVPLSVAESRDPKGLYKRARRGEITNMTGIDSVYEPPKHPDVYIDSITTLPHVAAKQIVGELSCSME